MDAGANAILCKLHMQRCYQIQLGIHNHSKAADELVMILTKEVLPTKCFLSD